MLRPPGLTDKEWRFAQAYLRLWNAAQAAREAGYADSTVRAASYLLLRKPAIAEIIAEELRQQEMQTEEVLARLSQQARINPSDFFVFEDQPRREKGVVVLGPDGEPVIERVMTGINWQVMESHGYLIKKLSYDRTGRPVLEFHDPQRALELLARRHGLLIDRRELSGVEGAAIEVIHVRADNDDDTD